MELLREKFYITYAKLPISLRDDIILVLEDIGSITWKVAYFEIKNNTEISDKILKELNDLKLI